MSFIEVEFHDEYFLDWVNKVEHSFIYMTQTMIRVAEKIKERVQKEFVPIKTGKLSRSFKWHIVTDNSRMKVVEIQMSALNPKTGYDYAMTQHRGYHINKYGTKVHYRRNKIIDTGFYNYRPAIVGKGYSKNTSDRNAWNLHRGSDNYMFWGIKYESHSAFEIIEKDYLSLFTEGYIL